VGAQLRGGVVGQLLGEEVAGADSRPARETGVAILRREAPICSGLRALYKFG
jgi:hypothetical protein